MKNNRLFKIGVVLSIILFGIGYAAITASLSISGTAKINGDSSNFQNNIIFESATAGSGSTATLSSNKKTITFSTKELKTINSTDILTYTIKNNSNYDATVAKVTCSVTDSSLASYITITPSRTTILNLSKGSTSSEETVTVKLVKAYPDVTAKNIAFTCTLTATAK